MSESAIKTIDEGLAIYYKSKGRDDYFDKNNEGKFQLTCDENGFGDDDVNDEMATNAEDCMLLEFDNNFPGVTNGDLNAIFAVVKACYKHGKDAVFGADDEMKYTKDAYQITKKEEQEIGDRYKRQCPKSFLGAMIKDASTFKLMMIGQKKNSPYIQNLVDDYLRCRVEVFLNTKKPLTTTQWSNNHPHFKLIKNISKTEFDLVEGAVKGFVGRICPVLLFQPVSKIQGSMEETSNLIFAAIRFVHGLVTETGKKLATDPVQGNCPFQLDFCIGFDPMKSEVNKNIGDDDSDDDDDDDTGTELKLSDNDVDLIGDIILKLESNKKHGVVYTAAEDTDLRIFRKCYDKYKRKTNPQESLRNKRIIGFADKRSKPFKLPDQRYQKLEKGMAFKMENVEYNIEMITDDGQVKCKQDGRIDKEFPDVIYLTKTQLKHVNFDIEEKEEQDRMVLYSPPNDCNNIPSDAVHEWGLSSTSMCLIPNERYKLQKMMTGGDDSKESVQQAFSTDQPQSQTIGCKDNASIITLSFHAKSADSIACYIYAMGQYSRFMPSDIVNILPLLFDENIGRNKSWGKDQETQRSIKAMGEMLVDKQFDNFRKSQCGRNV